jgi:hypothetical protein
LPCTRSPSHSVKNAPARGESSAISALIASSAACDLDLDLAAAGNTEVVRTNLALARHHLKRIESELSL